MCCAGKCAIMLLCAAMAESADASDLKSDTLWVCGFKSRLPHHQKKPEIFFRLLFLHLTERYKANPRYCIPALKDNS